MRISLTALTEQGPRDVVVSGDSNMTVETVARSLNSALNGEVVHLRAPTLWSGGRALDPSAPVARLLRDGALVATEPGRAPATVLAEPRGAVEVRVSGGPAAGAVHRLGIGETALGGADDVDVRLADPSVPPRALRIAVESGGVTVDGQGTLDGRPLNGATHWPYGGVLVVGDTVLTLAACTAPDAYLRSVEDGGLAYDRPPRAGRAGETHAAGARHRIEVPPRPERYRRRWLLAAALSVAAAAGLVAFTGRWYWGLLALAYPAFQAGEWIGDRPRRNATRRRNAGYDSALEDVLRAEEAERRALAPDPAEVLLTATGPRRRLWERRASDPDALHLRLGLADRPARVELVPEPRSGDPARRERSPGGASRGGGNRPEGHDDAAGPRPDAGAGSRAGGERAVARAVPVTLPLPELGVIGMSGPRDRSRGLARWLVAQAATLHSPRDLTVVVLCADASGAEHWNWVRWLPHCAPRDGEDCVALVGTDPDSVAHRVTELAVRITERRRQGRADGQVTHGGDGHGQRDGQDRQGQGDGQQGHGQGDGPGPVGRVAPPDILLVLDGVRRLRRVPGMAQVLSGGPGVGLRAICIDDDERLLPAECAAVAFWDWDRPTHVRLRGHGLDSVGPVLADQVSPAWCERLARALAPVRDDGPIPREARLRDLLGTPVAAWDGRGTTRVPVGVSGGGVVHVDVRSHVLIAGAPGSGKSELLRTLIAGLVAANRPDELALVLAGRFADCAALPHVVAAAADLDDRALESLDAELRRRAEILRRAGVADIAELRHGAPPRLVIVADEVAPDRLIDIARRGRSAGVHLLLAARRPTDAIAADARIALRLPDPADSTVMLGDPSAARIPASLPGRCYVRSGAAAPEAVQAARVRGADAPVRVVPLPWADLGRPVAFEEPADTDLAALVTQVREAAGRIGHRAESIFAVTRPPDTRTGPH